MNPSGLDFILNNDACRGAFKLDGATLTPLSPAPDCVHESAYRTRNMWASLGRVVSKAGLVIAKRGSDLSVASERGGIIVEAKGPMNLGMLKAALQHEDRVLPVDDSAQQIETSPGLKALWSLAEWIEATETPRHILIHLGAETLGLVAGKGQFQPCDGATPASVSKAVMKAAMDQTPIELGYGQLDDDHETPAQAPLALFGTDLNTSGEWVLKPDGTPVSIPQDAALPAVRNSAALAQQLGAWGEGMPFELSVLRDGQPKKIVASAQEPEEIRLTSSVSFE